MDEPVVRAEYPNMKALRRCLLPVIAGVYWNRLDPKLNAYDRLVELAYARGLIIYSRRTRGGKAGDHFLVAPPLIITEDQIAEMMAILRDALDAFAAEIGLPVESAA